MNSPEEREPETKDGYERTDVDVPALARVLGILVGATLVIALLMVGLFRVLETAERKDQPPPLSLVGRPEPGPPPEPRLQTTPIEDLRKLRASEDEILGTYGWVDRRAGVVRIPIARAMDLLVESGLPHRPSAGSPEPAAGGNSAGLSGGNPHLAPPPPPSEAVHGEGSGGVSGGKR